MNEIEQAIVAALSEGKAKTSADLIDALGERPQRVRYWLKRLAEQGVLVTTEFAGDSCPCCRRPLRRPLLLWSLQVAAAIPDPLPSRPRHAPSLLSPRLAVNGYRLAAR